MPLDRPEILLRPGGFLPAVVAAMESAYTVHRLAPEPARAAQLADIGPRVRSLVTTGSLGADAALLAALPRLEIIVSHGVGLDAIDLPGAAARNIPVTTTPGVLTADVADMALALLLAVCRRIAEGDTFVRSGKWAAGEALPMGVRLTGKRAGIVGLGQIGSAIARRLAGFDVSIGFVDPSPRPGTFESYRRYDHVDRLAAESDILIAAAAGSAQTRAIIGRGVLEALGPKGIFINVARGMLVDEEALLAALEGRKIAAAGLDVFLNEPKIDPRFSRLANVVVSPHQASATVETRQDMGRIVLENLAAHFAGRPLIGRV